MCLVQLPGLLCYRIIVLLLQNKINDDDDDERSLSGRRKFSQITFRKHTAMEIEQRVYLLTPMKPRDAASRSIDHRAIHRTGRRVQSTVDDRTSTVDRKLAKSAVNTGLISIAVYITLADGRRDVAKFSKFTDTFISVKHSVHTYIHTYVCKML